MRARKCPRASAGMFSNARTSRRDPAVRMRPRASLTLPAAVLGPGAPSKKNEIGTWSVSAIFANLPAPTRFTPFSYFWTCWNVTPSALARSVCDIRQTRRCARINWPTSLSLGSGAFAWDRAGDRLGAGMFHPLGSAPGLSAPKAEGSNPLKMRPPLPGWSLQVRELDSYNNSGRASSRPVPRNRSSRRSRTMRTGAGEQGLTPQTDGEGQLSTPFRIIVGRRGCGGQADD
jgi:hypothetical protein